jgi:hypothetical protein
MFCASCLPQTFPSSYRSDRSEQLRYPHRQDVFCDLQPRLAGVQAAKSENRTGTPDRELGPIRRSVGQQEVGRSSNTDRLSKLPLLERLTDTLMPSGSCGGETNDRIAHRGSWTDRSGDR